MLLTYSFTQFEQAILEGRKIHTLRADPKRRWKAGMSIQHWMGSPRNTRASRKPYQFATGVCSGTQEVKIHCHHGQWIDTIQIEVDGRFLDSLEIKTFIYSDGLEEDEFFNFFGDRKQKHSIWEGRIIHFTDYRY